MSVKLISSVRAFALCLCLFPSLSLGQEPGFDIAFARAEELAETAQDSASGHAAFAAAAHALALFRKAPEGSPDAWPTNEFRAVRLLLDIADTFETPPQTDLDLDALRKDFPDSALATLTLPATCDGDRKTRIEVQAWNTARNQDPVSAQNDWLALARNCTLEPAPRYRLYRLHYLAYRLGVPLTQLIADNLDASGAYKAFDRERRGGSIRVAELTEIDRPDSSPRRVSITFRCSGTPFTTVFFGWQGQPLRPRLTDTQQLAFDYEDFERSMNAILVDGTGCNHADALDNLEFPEVRALAKHIKAFPDFGVAALVEALRQATIKNGAPGFPLFRLQCSLRILDLARTPGPSQAYFQKLDRNLREENKEWFTIPSLYLETKVKPDGYLLRSYLGLMTYASLGLARCAYDPTLGDDYTRISAETQRASAALVLSLQLKVLSLTSRDGPRRSFGGWRTVDFGWGAAALSDPVGEDPGASPLRFIFLCNVAPGFAPYKIEESLLLSGVAPNGKTLVKVDTDQSQVLDWGPVEEFARVPELEEVALAVATTQISQDKLVLSLIAGTSARIMAPHLFTSQKTGDYILSLQGSSSAIAHARRTCRDQVARLRRR